VAQILSEWLTNDVKKMQGQSVRWLSQNYFFRDPPRATFVDPTFFFSPADGVILYQRVVDPATDAIVDIKGRPYGLRDALRDPTYALPSVVIGIFMTFYDVHVNRIPYSGFLRYRHLDPIDTYNHPMLAVEKEMLEASRPSFREAEYLHHNQRMVNRIESTQLGQPYYVLQVADYDVDCITPFDVRQGQPRLQGERFSQIRFGSQVDLIVPLSDRWEFEFVQEVGYHVEAGVDPVLKIVTRGDDR
jgi:phosphatidylserine decarboxylase